MPSRVTTSRFQARVFVFDGPLHFFAPGYQLVAIWLMKALCQYVGLGMSCLWFHLLIHPFPRSVKFVIKVFKVSWRTLVAYDLYWREPMLIYMRQVSIWTCWLVELWGRSMAVNPLFPLMHSPISEAVLLDSGIIVIVVSISELLGTIAYSFFWPVHQICANFCVFALFLMFLI